MCASSSGMHGEAWRSTAIAKALRSTSPPPRFVAGDVNVAQLEIDPTAIVTDRVIVRILETEPAMV